MGKYIHQNEQTVIFYVESYRYIDKAQVRKQVIRPRNIVLLLTHIRSFLKRPIPTSENTVAHWIICADIDNCWPCGALGENVPTFTCSERPVGKFQRLLISYSASDFFFSSRTTRSPTGFFTWIFFRKGWSWKRCEILS